jgi:Tfp pilus assembly protein PilZ
MSDWQVPRREHRYRFQIPVTLRTAQRAVPLMTEDISFSGMFLRTDTPPPLRGLIKLEVPVEGLVEPLALTAMVVHSITPEASAGRVPGAGIQLYGVGAKIRDQWARYVMALRDQHPDAAARPVRVEVARPGAPEPVNRLHARFAASLQVRARTVDELIATYTRDISRGGTFLVTELSLAAGDKLHVELVHPDNGEGFALEGVVRRVVRDGVGVEFRDLDEAKQQAFWTFVESAIELDDDDLMIIE